MDMNEIKGDYMSDKQESLLKLAELFKILGDPTRLKIVELLLENEMCVNHIAETMGMGQSAISHQLRVLRQARLVTYRKEGKTAYYSLNDDHVEGLVRMVWNTYLINNTFFTMNTFHHIMNERCF